MWVFNDHSCFTEELTDGLPPEGMQRPPRRQVLVAPPFPDNLAKTFGHAAQQYFYLSLKCMLNSTNINNIKLQ